MTEEYVIYLTSCPMDGELTGYDGPGWYFSDEAYYIHGPFNTKKETEEHFKVYLREELNCEA